MQLATDILKVVQAATLIKIIVCNMFEVGNAFLIKAHALLSWLVGNSLPDHFNSQIKNILQICGKKTSYVRTTYILCLCEKRESRL